MTGDVEFGWKFFLCDTATSARIGQLTMARNRQLSVVLNRSGSFTCDLDLSDPLASLLVPQRTYIEAQKQYVSNGGIVWSGPIESLDYALPGHSVRIQCVGWFELLKRRLIRDRGLVSHTIANPGYESNTGAPTSWVNASNGTGTISAVAAQPHGGTNSLKLTANSGGNNAAVYQDVTAPLGVTVTLRLWVRLTLGVTTVGDYLQIGAQAPSFGGFWFSKLYDVGGGAFTTAYTQIEASWVNGYQTNFSICALLASAGSTQLSIDDWELEYDTLSFEDVDIGEIAERLVDYANTKDSCPVTRGTGVGSWNRTVRYTPFQNIGEEIQRMSDVENGFDFEIDPVSKQLDIYYPMKGTFHGSYDSPSTAYDKSGPTFAWRFQDASTTTSPSTHGLPVMAMNNSTGAAWVASQPTLCSYDPTDFSKTKVMGLNSVFGQIGDSNYVDINSTSYSASFVFKLSSFASMTRMDFISIYANGPLAQLNSDGSIQFYPGTAVGEVLTAGAGTIVAGTTYHVVFTYDHATKTGAIFVNGALAATGVCVSGSRTIQSWLTYYFSQALGAGTPTLTVDEIAVWIGRSLSLSEITSMYQSLRLRTGAAQGFDIHFGWGERGPRNLASFGKLVDSGTMSNWIAVQGKGSSGGSGALARNEASIAAYGAFDEAVSLSQTDSIDILASFANAEIAVRSTPRVLYTFQPLPQTVPTVTGFEGDVPNPFVEYNVGDIVALDALEVVRDSLGVELHRPIDVTDQNVRIFGITVNLDENDVERITLLTAPGN